MNWALSNVCKIMEPISRPSDVGDWSYAVEDSMFKPDQCCHCMTRTGKNNLSEHNTLSGNNNLRR